jgi:hypothetical protein
LQRPKKVQPPIPLALEDGVPNADDESVAETHVDEQGAEPVEQGAVAEEAPERPRRSQRTRQQPANLYQVLLFRSWVFPNHLPLPPILQKSSMQHTCQVMPLLSQGKQCLRITPILQILATCSSCGRYHTAKRWTASMKWVLFPKWQPTTYITVHEC